MVRKSFEITNPLGLHTRPASLLVKTANRFHSDILIRNGDIQVNGKSIMGVLTLVAVQGTILELEIDGVDEKPALEAIENLFLEGFQEAYKK